MFESLNNSNDTTSDGPLKHGQNSESRFVRLQWDKVAISRIFTENGLAPMQFIEALPSGTHRVYLCKAYTSPRQYIVRLSQKTKEPLFESAARWQGHLAAVGIPMPSILYLDPRANKLRPAYMVVEHCQGAELFQAAKNLRPNEIRTVASDWMVIQNRVRRLPSLDRFGTSLGYGDQKMHHSWRAVLEDQVVSAINQIRRRGTVSDNFGGQVFSAIGSLASKIAKSPGEPFLDDLCHKNFLICEGRIITVLDTDVLCFGDFLYALGQTYAGLVRAGLPTGFVDEVKEFASSSPFACERTDLYSAIFLLDFLSKIGRRNSFGEVGVVSHDQISRINQALEDILYKSKRRKAVGRLIVPTQLKELRQHRGFSVGILSRLEIPGGSEQRVVGLANIATNMLGARAVVLGENDCLPKMLRRKLDPVIPFFGRWRDDPLANSIVTRLDTIIVVLSNNTRFVTCEYWQRVADNCKKLGRQLPRLIFVVNYNLESVEHLGQLNKLFPSIKVCVANSSFAKAIRSEARFESLRGNSLSVLPSPIDIQRFYLPKAEGFTCGMYSFPYVHKWNPCLPGIVQSLDKLGAGITWRFMGMPTHFTQSFCKREDVITLRVFEEPPEKFLQKIKVFLFLPRWEWQEAWSRSVAEALASGCPVIATASGGNLDQIEDGVNGLLCHNEREVCEAALSLSKDPLLLARLREGALRSAARFSFEAVAQGLSDILYIGGSVNSDGE